MRLIRVPLPIVVFSVGAGDLMAKRGVSAEARWGALFEPLGQDVVVILVSRSAAAIYIYVYIYGI